MQRKNFGILMALLAVAFASTASAEVMDRPQGIRIGQRMTLRPYVSMSATYDSNVSARHSDEDGDVLWTINPSLGIDYKAENWALAMNVYYNYRAYCKDNHVNNDNLAQHSYGETLRWNWANSHGAEKGWSLMLQESFKKISAADDIASSDGRGYSTDRSQFDVNGAAQRRFNENFHGDVYAGYYDLRYDNDSRNYSLYGWKRWNAGLQAGYAPSRWTDMLLTGSYQGYSQDNVDGTLYGRDSQGFSVQGGMGSFATERISYRVLAGWSRFEYAGNAASNDGFVYTVSGNWKISDTLTTMLLATSYYQPSERELASRSRIDGGSWGIAKTMVRGKLNATMDIAYRHETHELIGSGSSDYALDILTARLGFSYALNRFLTGFIYGEYQGSWNDHGEKMNWSQDYDRWRVTTGVRLTY